MSGNLSPEEKSRRWLDETYYGKCVRHDEYQTFGLRQSRCIRTPAFRLFPPFFSCPPPFPPPYFREMEDPTSISIIQTGCHIVI